MNERHLRIFIEVYQRLNITQAASHLYMSQPAVSKAIREIEEEYGAQLFERMNHRLYRTQLSREVYGYALQILESKKQLEALLKNEEQQELIRIGASITLGTYLLPGLAQQFQKEYPACRMEVQIQSGNIIAQKLAENELDLGFIEGKANQEGLISKPIGQDRLVLIASPNHELTIKKEVYLKDLSAYPLLMRDQNSMGRKLAEHAFAHQGLLLHPLWESASTQALIAAVIAGIGISILPLSMVKEALAQKKVAVIKVKDESFERSNYAVYHKQKVLSAPMQKLIELAQSRMDEM